MAAAAPATASQEPQKPAGPSHPLDNLQAMMNLVLISSGRFMKSAHQAGPDTARMEFTLQRAVSAANERFHDSLDELENDIFHAQAVLRRDLALLRADRKKKEAVVKEKEAEKARLAAESSAKKKHVSPKKEQPPAPPAPTKAPSPPPVKVEPPKPAAAEPPALQRKVEEPPALKVSTPPADVLMGNTENANTAQESEFDFDAIFGDSIMPTSGDGTNDSADPTMSATGADLNFNLDDQPSLLRGLEDFAKGGEEDNSGENNATNLDLDFTMTDMPDLNQTVEPPANTKPQGTADQPMANAGDLTLDTMTADNLDDLFDLDYVNPEATQFDDAFFGFGES